MRIILKFFVIKKSPYETLPTVFDNTTDANWDFIDSILLNEIKYTDNI